MKHFTTSTPVPRWGAAALAGTLIALSPIATAAPAQMKGQRPASRPAAQTQKKLPPPYQTATRPAQTARPAARPAEPTVQRAEFVEEIPPEKKSIWNKIASAPKSAWDSSTSAVKKSTSYIPFVGEKDPEPAAAPVPAPAAPPETKRQVTNQKKAAAAAKPTAPPATMSQDDDFAVIDNEPSSKPVWSRFIPSFSSKSEEPAVVEQEPTPADIASARSRSKKQFGPVIKDRPKPAPQVAETQANPPDGKPIWNRVSTLWPFQGDDGEASAAIPEAKIEVVSIDDAPFYPAGSTKGASPAGYLTTGTLVQIESKSWGWSNIRLSDGRTGMVPKKMLRSANSSDLIATKKPGKLPTDQRTALASRSPGSGFRSKPRNPANYIGPVTLPPVALPDLPSASPEATARTDANATDSSLLPPLDPSSPNGAPFSASPLEGSEIPPPTEPPVATPGVTTEVKKP